MGERSHHRGSKDTLQGALFEHVRMPARRAFTIAMIVALALHLPFIPSRLFLWLSIWWQADTTEEPNETDGEVIIPIDFDLEPGQTADPKAPVAEGLALPDDSFTEPVAIAPIVTPKKKPPESAADAGVVDGGDDAGENDAGGDAALADAGDIADAGADDASTSNDSGTPDQDAAVPIARVDSDGGAGASAALDAGTNLPDAGPVDAGPIDAGPVDAGPVTRDPMVVAGSPSDLVGKNPAVKILIAGDRLRKYELGKMFGDVLSAIPQWQSFIGTSGIDPVRDIDHMLIAGPGLVDSRKVVVVMDLNVPDTKARATIDGIIKRSTPKGKWLEGTPVPAAIAQAEKGERIFAMVPGKHLVVVLPAEAKDQLKQVKAIKPFNKSSAVGIALHLLTPHNAFNRTPVKIPNTLKWMRINVIPTDDSGVDVVLEAQDKDETLAREHAAQLELLLEAFRGIDIPFVGRFEVIGKTPFVSSGSLIRAETHVTKKQLIYIMGFAKQRLEEQAKLAADAGPSK